MKLLLKTNKPPSLPPAAWHPVTPLCQSPATRPPEEDTARISSWTSSRCLEVSWAPVQLQWHQAFACEMQPVQCSLCSSAQYRSQMLLHFLYIQHAKSVVATFMYRSGWEEGGGFDRWVETIGFGTLSPGMVAWSCGRHTLTTAFS